MLVLSRTWKRLTRELMCFPAEDDDNTYINTLNANQYIYIFSAMVAPHGFTSFQGKLPGTVDNLY